MRLSDRTIVTHLLAFIAGGVVAWFALPAFFGSQFYETVQRRLPMMEARVASSRPTASPVRSVPQDLTASLIIPVQGVSKSQLIDTFTQARGTDRLHDAIDIMAPEGTPVMAAADGRIEKLHLSDAGGITIYQFTTDRRYSLYYAHLSSYVPALAEGMQVRKGEVIGYVGHTGNASPDGPHLHFAVNALQPNARWSDGEPVNPYPILQGR